MKYDKAHHTHKVFMYRTQHTHNSLLHVVKLKVDKKRNKN